MNAIAFIPRPIVCPRMLRSGSEPAASSFTAVGRSL